MFKKITTTTAIMLIGVSTLFGFTLSAEETSTNSIEVINNLDEGKVSELDSYYQEVETHSTGSTIYMGEMVSYNNIYCPSNLNGTYKSKTVGGGTMHYGCYRTPSGADKPYTDYIKNTTADYRGYTYYDSNYKNYGNIASHNSWSKYSELNAKSGNFYHKVQVYM